jgi:hypothetical protein
MKQVFNGLLIVAIIVLVYLCTMSIITPIRFEQERVEREAAVIQKLVDIRKAQIEFRKQNQHYTASFDSLIYFVNEGKMPVVLKEGTLTDKELEEGLTEAEAVKRGIIRRDTNYVSVKETLFGNSYPAQSMGEVPFGGGAQFEMAAGVIKTGSGIEVQVFEAKTPYNVYLQGMDKQEIINLNAVAEKLDKYAGLQVGSILEANNNAGNWE